MNKIEKTEQYTRTVTMYEAVDGKVFYSEKSCQDYEKTAEIAIRQTLGFEKLGIKADGLDNLIDDGYGRSEYFKFEIKNEEQKKLIIQLIELKKTVDKYSILGNSDYWKEENRNERNKYVMLDEIEVGKTYIWHDCDECESCGLISPEKLKKMLEYSINAIYN